MIGDSYIVREPGNYNKKIRYVGRNLRVDPSVSGGYGEFQIEHMNKAKINNLVFSLHQEKQGGFSCTNPQCQQHCEIVNKQQMLNMNKSAHFNEEVERECVDGEHYAVCTHCSKIHSLPEVHIVPKSKTYSVVCPNCLDQTHGTVRSLKPKEMNEIPNDPDTPKHWYWSCALGCGYRYLMEYHQLKAEVVGEQKTFLKSLETIKKPSGISDEDRRDMEHLGKITSVVDQRDFYYDEGGGWSG